LDTFSLPAKVTTIVDNAFENCKALKTTDFAPVNSELVTLGDASFKDCTSLDTMIFPESLLALGDSTFMGCVELANMTLPALLQRLGQQTFRGCTALRTVVFPESLQSVVGRGTFLEATGVRTLKMHPGIKDRVVPTLPIAAERQLMTFYQDLDYVYSPRTLAVQRDPWAYDQVQGKTVPRVYDGTMTLLGPGQLTQSQVNAAIDEHTYQHGMNNVLHTLFIGEYIESLGPSAISSTSLQSIIFDPQSNVTRIYRKGLSTNLALTELVLPPGLAHLSEQLCAGCVSLKNITIPANVKSIGYRAFHGCSLLDSFSLPAKVTTVVNNAFENCQALKTTDFAPVNSELVTLGDAVFKDCTNLDTIIFPDSLVTLGDFLFQGATSISSVTLNQNLWTTTLLPPHVNGLAQTVSYSNDPTVIYSVKNGVLAASTGLVYDVLTSTMTGTYDGRPLRVSGSGELTQTQLALVLAAYAADNGSRLITLDVDKSFQTLGPGAFANRTTLSSILFPADSALLTIGSSAFQGCTALNRIAVPANVTTIGDLAFDSATSLETVDFVPLSKLTSLGNTVFKDCSSLRTVQFPGSLSALQDSTFFGCTALTEMILPESLTSLGTATFQNCTSLQNVVLPRSLLTIDGTTTFAGATAIQTLKMPENLWETNIKPSIVQNPKVVSQLVQFYGDPDILQSLETQRDIWDGLEGGTSANTEGYQNVVDFYSRKDNYTIDYLSSGTTTLVKFGGTAGLTFDVDTGTLSGLGTYDGALTIVGSGGELTQSFVNAAISAHTVAQNGVMPLRTLTVGPAFTSLDAFLSLEGTGITKLSFPAESPITTTGSFGLAIDSTLAKIVVLPRWVVQQGPWSL
jgi:hypothetical protein